MTSYDAGGKHAHDLLRRDELRLLEQPNVLLHAALALHYASSDALRDRVLLAYTHTRTVRTGQVIEQLSELLAEALQRWVARLVGRTEQLGQLIKRRRADREGAVGRQANRLCPSERARPAWRNAP